MSEEQEQILQQEEVTEEAVEENTIMRGYAVGIDQHERITFHVIGENLKLAELAGLHKVAEFKIESAIQSSLSSGWPLVAAGLTKGHNDIAEALGSIAEHLQRLTEKLETTSDK